MGVNSNGDEVEVNDTDESNQEIGQINYRTQYLQLKKKLKLLLFVSNVFTYAVPNISYVLWCYRKMNSFKRICVKTRRDC